MNADNYTMAQVNKVLKDCGAEIRRDYEVEENGSLCNWYVVERCPHFSKIIDGDWWDVFERACWIMRDHGMLDYLDNELTYMDTPIHIKQQQ